MSDFQNTVSIKKYMVTFALVFLNILFLGGCQQSVAESGLLQNGKLSSYEALYGQSMNAVLKGLALQEKQVTQCSEPGLWEIDKKWKIQGKEFKFYLLFDVTTNELYGYRYRFQGTDSNQILEVSKELMAEANKIYGETTTYPGLTNRLVSENFSSDFLEFMNSGKVSEWREEWIVSEKTQSTLSVKVIETNVASISLEYVLAK